MKLFDYIKIIFGSDIQWDKTKNYDKSKNSFMLNRFMSIKFPAQAQLFNMLRTDPVGQAEAWRMVTSKFNRVPGFIYTKVSKKKIQKEWEPDQQALDFYLQINEIGMREFNEALKYDRSTVISVIDKLKSQITNDRSI